jgi:hypothetical protein
MYMGQADMSCLKKGEKPVSDPFIRSKKGTFPLRIDPLEEDNPKDRMLLIPCCPVVYASSFSA